MTPEFQRSFREGNTFLDHVRTGPRGVYGMSTRRISSRVQLVSCLKTRSHQMTLESDMWKDGEYTASPVYLLPSPRRLPVMQLLVKARAHEVLIQTAILPCLQMLDWPASTW